MKTQQKIKFFLILIPILSLGLARPEAAAANSPLQLALLPYVTSGLDDPIALANAGPGDNRLFVVERDGRIKIIQPNGTVLPTPFLDISDRVFSLADNDSDSDPGSEQGLLGLAFHPNYASNGYFYVNYIFEVDSDDWLTRISRFQVTADPNIANKASEQILLTIDQPARNHNAGALHFGPNDGYLYIPMGDGGGSGDNAGSGNNAQTLSRLLGKIIRIDVDLGPGDDPDCEGQGTGNYKIPPTNPFINDATFPNTCDEIWAIGLRNPWRSSFDRLTGDFYIGDVGQGTWEEIDFQAHDSAGGLNYGWRCYEGNHPYPPGTTPTGNCTPMNKFTFPIFEYNQTGNGCTVIGGYVYRGIQYPVMLGRYLLADYCTGNFWDLERQGNTWQPIKHTHLANFGYTAFGEDANGELYVVNLDENRVYRLVENSLLTKYFFPLILKQG